MKAAFLCALDATTIFNTFLPIHVGVLWHYWRCSSSCCLIYCSLLFYVYPKTNVSHQEKEQRTTKIHFFSVPFLTFSCRSVQPDDAGKYECQVSTLPKKSHFLHLSVIGKFVHSKKIGFAWPWIHSFSSSQCENLWRPWHFCQILFNSSITLRCFTKSCASHLYRMETQRGAFAFNHLFIELLQRGQITNHTTRAHRGRHDGQHADHLSRRDLRFGEVHLFASTIRGSIS